jgi:hypothetical protein
MELFCLIYYKIQMYCRSRKDSDAEMEIYMHEGTINRDDGSSFPMGPSDLQFIILSAVVCGIMFFFL